MLKYINAAGRTADLEIKEDAAKPNLRKIEKWFSNLSLKEFEKMIIFPTPARGNANGISEFIKQKEKGAVIVILHLLLSSFFFCVLCF